MVIADREDLNYIGLAYYNDVSNNMELIKVRVEIPWKYVSVLEEDHILGKRNSKVLANVPLTIVYTLDNRTITVVGDIDDLMEKRHNASKMMNL